ncbi:hypothetical protein [Francisella marina]|uniref:hypothetical protein n=1 Tax=Francisella marina TaxID=2249302 RepID=UPI0011EF2BCE|nr:hypothetical protein [Francisella marina]QEO58319.1 hypothetical protein F0R75_00480 [Francisella marina]
MPITQEQFDSLPDELKELYQVSDDGYELNAVKKDEVNGLANTKDKLLAEKKQLKAQFDDLQNKLNALEDEKLASREDFESLSNKYKSESEQWKTQLEDFKKAIADKEVQRQTLSVASELFGNDAELFTPHVSKYLRFNEDSQSVSAFDGEAELSINQLKEKLKGDERLSKYIVVSHASGGGAIGNRSHTGTAKSLKEMTASEQTKLANENPELYIQLSKQ